MKGFIADIRHALRLHRSTPLSSALAIAALTASFAFVTAFLSLWSELSLKPDAGFERGPDIVSVGQTKGERMLPVNLRFITDVDTGVGALQGLAGVMFSALRMEADDHEELMRSELVTRGYFQTLRPGLALGRGFVDADHDAHAEPVVVISHAYWMYRFEGDPDAIGRELLMNGPAWADPDALGAESARRYRIVGVMSPDLAGTFRSDTDQWLPFERSVASTFPGVIGDFTQMSSLLALGRLSSGARLAALRNELSFRYAGEGSTDLGLRSDYRLEAVRGIVSNIGHHRDAERHVKLALFSALLVLVVAAFNLSLFLLAQAPGRRRELGVRLAVGATFARLIRQLATEATLIALVAATLGIIASLWLTALVQELAVFRHIPLEGASPLDWRVVIAIALMTAMLAFLASLAPIAVLQRVSIAAGSRDNTSGGRLQRLAGTAQVACAAALACVALAIGSHLIALQRIDPGFDPTGLVAVRAAPMQVGRGDDWGRLSAEREQRRAALLGHAEVEAVAFASQVPGEPLLFATHAASPSVEQADLRAILISADAAFPELLGMRLARGRHLHAHEADAVLVNETMARAFWGRMDVVGETLSLSAQATAGGLQQVTVAGVLSDVNFAHPGTRVEPMVVVPMVSNSSADLALVRTSLAPSELMERLTRLEHTDTLAFPVTSVESLPDIWGRLLAEDRARTMIATVSAVLVLVLSTLGFHGTLRYLVNAGRREYAIRAAMGADPAAIRRLVVWRGASMGLPGLAIGCLAGWMLVASLRGELVSREISPTFVTLTVAAVMAGLIVLVSLGPARNACRTRPAMVLREE